MTIPTKEQDQAYEFIKAITDAVTEDEFPLALVNAVAALTAERDDYKAALEKIAKDGRTNSQQCLLKVMLAADVLPARAAEPEVKP